MRSMRFFIVLPLWALLPAGVAIVATNCGAPASPDRHAASPARPNIIWICLDACRAKNLSCYGYDRPTSPNIDRLAAHGVLFEQNFSQAFNTPISVSQFLTGRHFPVCYAETREWREASRVPPEEEQLAPRIFSENGYYSVMIGTQEFFPSRSRLGRGFDRTYFLPHKVITRSAGGESSEGPAKAARQFDTVEPYAPFSRIVETVERVLRKEQSKPLFLYIHAMETHFPHVLEPEYRRWIDLDYTSDLIGDGYPKQYSGNRFSPQDIELLRGFYDGGILKADDYVGRLLDLLQSKGALDDAIVLITSDHGELIGENADSVGHAQYNHFSHYVLGGPFPDRVTMQNPCYTHDEVCHVPLIMAGTGLPEGLRVKALTQNADILPTLLDMLGMKTSARFDGKSVRTLFAGPTRSVHEYVFCRDTSYGLDATPRLIARDAQYKYSMGIPGEEDLLWPLPDSILTRGEALTSAPHIAAMMRERLERDMAPLWQAYDALPRVTPTSPFLERIDSAVLEEASPAGETPRRATFAFSVPDGDYEVDLDVMAMHTAGAGREEPVIAGVALQDTPRVEQKLPSTPNPTFLRLGLARIRQAPCRITVDIADADVLFTVLGAWFRPLHGSAPPASTDDLRGKEESLKTLGYIQ
ncbi:MAG TPA: sulfatase [Candidatus Hydrogenedentes bacterium]|nr:sulfatase [Candidatus Hydrogenedentota bacterium]